MWEGRIGGRTTRRRPGAACLQAGMFFACLLPILVGCESDDQGADADGFTSDAGRDGSFGDGSQGGTPVAANWVTWSSKRNGQYDVYRARLDGTGTKRITMRDDPDLYPSWSADGSRIVFASSSQGAPQQLFVIDVATEEVTPIVTNLTRSTSAVFAPTGLRIAFEGIAPEGTNPDLYIMDLATEDPPTQVTTDADIDAGPSWAPDGKSLYFVRRRSGAYDIWRVDANGDDELRITTGTNILGRQALSHDGTKLAYARSAPQGMGSAIYVYDIDSQAHTLFSDNNDSEPAYSPDGLRLAMTTLRYVDQAAPLPVANPEIVLVDAADAGNPVRLTNAPSIDGSASFSPPALELD